jgi:hypothetical protein
MNNEFSLRSHFPWKDCDLLLSVIENQKKKGPSVGPQGTVQATFTSEVENNKNANFFF